MPENTITRCTRLTAIAIPVVLSLGCFGDGDGQERVAGTPQPSLTGAFVDSPVQGATYATSGGGAGLTNAAGEFQYIANESVTFSIGGIVLGTTAGAPLITAVELTGSANPTIQAALNQLVFLQSIDSDSDPVNGITISDNTRSLAEGLTLDFNGANFATEVVSIVARITEPDNAVVSESAALAHFYDTYAALGGTDAFSWLFPGFPPVGAGNIYVLVFSDEFDEGSAPASDKWNIETGYGQGNDGWGNNEWQLYTDSSDNLRVEDGNLVISAQCDGPCGVRDGSVTSARINTQDKFEFTFGRIEARIKVPVGEGAWPAFWSLGANFPDVGWPSAGEIDFMEAHNFFSDENTTHFTIHWCDETLQAPDPCTFPAGRVFDSQSRRLNESLGDDFHIFEAEWTAERIIGKIDGVTYFSRAIQPSTMEEFRRDFFLIFNVAMGGTLGSGDQPPSGSEMFPQTMLVDYVRVYQQTGGSSGTEDTLIDFEDAPETYDFGPSGGFGGGAAAVIDNPVPGGINTSAQVGRMLKFPGELFAGSLLTPSAPLEITEGGEVTMKVWSQREVDVTFKFEGPVDFERVVAHGGTGWELLTFDFSSFTGTVEGLTFIFDNGIPGDATNDPDNWTFYFDDILLPTGSDGDSGPSGGLVTDFEDNPESYDFGPDGGFGGGAAGVIANPVAGGINTSAQVARMFKFAADDFGGALLSLPTPLTVPSGSSFTMKVWSPREVMVLFKLEGGAGDPEVNLAHGGSGWEELTFDFAGVDSVFTGITVIFDLGIVGDATGDPDNWTFYYDDITLVVSDGGDPGGGFDPEAPVDFEAAASNYDFGPGGGFEGGAAAVVENPVPGGINTSAFVGRMLKFDGASFAGSTLLLPSPVTLPADKAFTMKVWSPREVNVLFKLEGIMGAEVEVTHGGTGWEELTFDFSAFAGDTTGYTLIFDNGIIGDATNDPDNWTFYFDDITLIDAGGDPGGGNLTQIDLPITFEDATIDYTVTDFGTPTPAMTTLITDPNDPNNTVAATLKPFGSPASAGTTMSTQAGLANAIPFTANTQTIGVRVRSPAAGIPVRLKADNVVGGLFSVQTETMTTVANQWETLVFNFANPVANTAALDLNTTYTALSIFFDFGTDGNTAGAQTYLWDDVEFGVAPPVVDMTAPMLTSVGIVSSNVDPTIAAAGDVVTVALTANEPIAPPTVTIAGAAATSVTGSGTSWQASRALTATDAGGAVTFSIAFADLAGNAAQAVTQVTNGSSVTLDVMAPTLTIGGAPATFMTLSAIPLTFQFSEAVTGFALGDIQVTRGIASALVAVDAATYTANVTPNGSGDLVIAVAAGAATDVVGNASEMATEVTVVAALDANAPLLTDVSIASSNPDPTVAKVGDIVTIVMTANEEIIAPVVTIAGLPAETVSGLGTDWQASRELLATDMQGEITFVIDLEDLGGNPGLQATVTTDASQVTFDRTAPTLTIVGLPADVETLDPISVSFEFDEDVVGFELADIAVTNGVASAFASVDAATYTASVTPDGNGDVTVAAAADAAADAAGNGSGAASVSGTLGNLLPFWQIVWSDDFASGSLNGTNWTARTDADCPPPCDGLQSYASDRVSVAGGALTIQAISSAGPSYTSGVVDTRGKREFTFGRVEIDATMPATVGFAPSLRLLPVDEAYGPHPSSGDVAIVSAPDMESGVNQTLEHTLRYGLPVPEDTATTVEYEALTAPELSSITYAIEWEGGEIRWFVDGVHVATQTEGNWYAYGPDADGINTLGIGAAPFDEAFYLVLDLAIGSNVGMGSAFPQALTVDEVRVYRCANAVDPATGMGCGTSDPGIVAPTAAGAPFTDMLNVYLDAPEVFTYDTLGAAVTNSLTTGIVDTPPGGVVSSDPAFADGGNTLWRATFTADDPGDVGSVFIASEDLSASPVLNTGFELSGAEAAGEVLFDLRVNSVTAGTVLMAKVESSPGNGGQVALPLPADDAWNTVSVKVAELLDDQFGAGLDLASVVNLLVVEATDGTVELDLDNIRVKVACRDTDGCGVDQRFKTLLYGQDLESFADPVASNALSADGWKVGANVFDPTGTMFLYNYFAFPAPNGGPAFSAVASGEGGADQGAYQMSIYNDYNNTDHAVGNRIEANVFRERSVTADDVGKTLVFSFEAKRGNINDATDSGCVMTPNPPCDSTAKAFIKTLNPAMGFSESAADSLDTTSLPVGWARYTLSIDIPDSSFVGHLLQFGFLTVASDYEPSGVFYDNLQVRSAPIAP